MMIRRCVSSPRLPSNRLAGSRFCSRREASRQLNAQRQNKPDAILMDLVMPDVDGPDVLQTLRKHESTDKIPIIFHTAKTDPSEVRGMLALGAKGVIGKPFDPAALAEEIERILES